MYCYLNMQPKPSPNSDLNYLLLTASQTSDTLFGYVFCKIEHTQFF